ncbi:hypothetical protein HMF8227_00310 [Saliniradius amylolyticus]|uniref:DUF4224 domain-containing protein n=1 Tax=Saliniradius amylolyticus TaxID=2183582 RepID=A0A2S2E1A8_9ALTE|nr:DUF4224 domain-containing protein [Saliniradius amylolyticus]AWL10817.1 hypothetical protein HMF8227_00310 [Saliniradius amylolyticus]
MFISRDELQELTGYKKKSLQVQQLQDFGIPFEVNRLGAPIVLRSSVEDALSISKSPKRRTHSINLKSLHEAKAR